MKVFEKEKPWSNFISPGDFPIKVGTFLCRSCGWIFRNPSYDPLELDRLYSEGQAGYEVEVNGMAAGNAAIRGRSIFTALEPWLPGAKGCVLDVGGRNGELMGTFLDQGYLVTVLDMARGDPVSAAIAKVRCSFLDWHGGQFAVLVMSHVLEHTDNPLGFLQHGRELLAESGLLFLEVPCELVTPLLRRHVGDHRHLGYFSTSTLRAFLERSGFACLECKLLVGLAGAPISVIRAVGRKIGGNRYMGWRPGHFMVLRTLAEVVKPIVWKSRLMNKLFIC